MTATELADVAWNLDDLVGADGPAGVDRLLDDAAGRAARFNAAYAGGKGMRAYITRFSSLTDLEGFIARGVPLALSIGWEVGTLQSAHLPSSGGHIIVLRGFTKTGDPIINDPAAPSNSSVRTVYNRAQLERAWIAHLGGIVYVIEAN